VFQIKLVLKEDVAGLYETSWEPFVQGSSARQIQRFHARQKLVEKLHVFERGLHAKIIKAELWKIEGASKVPMRLSIIKSTKICLYETLCSFSERFSNVVWRLSTPCRHRRSDRK
jgi:hypothetical protein